MDVLMRFQLWWRNCSIVILTACVCVSQCQGRMCRPAHCRDSVLSRAHRYQVLRSRSVLECLSLCQLDGHCRSIVFDADHFLCYFGNAISAENCSNMEPVFGKQQFYEEKSPSSEVTLEPTSQSTDAGSERVTDTSFLPTTDESISSGTDSSTDMSLIETSTNPCQNGGQQDGNGSCICAKSYFGQRCENLIQDCTEGRTSGRFTEHGVYLIQPALSPAPFSVYCQMLAGNTRTYILNRDDPAFSLNRTWQDFRDGFGDVRSDYWLGLEKLYQLTNSKTYQFRFRIKPNGQSFYYFYSSFVLNDEASGYSFSIGKALSSTLQDCMSDLQGARFSTYDVDYDNSSNINCAAVFGGGWWYSEANCSACNLLGPILSSNGQRVGVAGEMFWAGFGSSYPFPLVVYLVIPP